MGDLSEHFDRREFACSGVGCCGNSAPVNLRLVEALEALRGLAEGKYGYGAIRFDVSSGFRCRAHNGLVGGADGSYHTLGMAADVVPRGVSVPDLAALAEFVEGFKVGGIGVYCGWVHLDVRRDGPARW